MRIELYYSNFDVEILSSILNILSQALTETGLVYLILLFFLVSHLRLSQRIDRRLSRCKQLGSSTGRQTGGPTKV